MDIMKHLIAIVLLCLPTQLSAGERCNHPRAHRGEVARIVHAKPPASRIEIARPQRARPSTTWRVLLFEQQIL